jgi:hypothetical protein
MGTNAFTKTGNTVAFTANVAAPTAVQCSSTTLGGNQYRVVNGGNVTVFLGYGVTSGDASNNSTVVTTTGAAIPLLSGAVEILTFVPNAYFTGTTAANTAVVYITPGDGI